MSDLIVRFDCPTYSRGFPLGPAIEAVLDSSRYFVVRIQNEGGQSANVGIGFADRGDSFDLNVALQDYFKGQSGFFSSFHRIARLLQKSVGIPSLLDILVLNVKCICAR